MNAKAHFQVLGIPVRIEPFFWIASVLLAYNLGDARLIIMWVAVVLVSVLVHELGHAVTLKAFGQPSSIVLHGFGGLTSSGRRLDRVRSIAVTLAGPLAALVLLGMPALLLRESDYGVEMRFDYQLGDQVFGVWPVIVFTAYVNIWWSIANLLPIRPLDGGNVLTELVGIQRARLVSVVVGTAAAVWAYTQSDAFRYAAFFAGFLVFINLSEYRKANQGARAPSAFDVEGPAVPGGAASRRGPDRPAGSAGDRRGQARHRGRPTGPPTARPEPVLHVPGGLDAASAESLAWNLLRRGDAPGARRVLARATGPVSPFVPATVAVASGDGIEDLVDAYLSRPSGPANLVPASVVADAGSAVALARRLLSADPTGVEAVSGLQTHLHYAERFGDAAQVGALLHDVVTNARAQVAFDTACSWARAGEPDKGLAWLRTALDDGFHAAALLDGEPDLDAVRALPGWMDVRRRLP